MKNHFLLFCLSFLLLAFTAQAQKKVDTLSNCLNLTDAINGKLIFSVNDEQTADNKKVYPKRCRIKIYVKGKLEKVFALAKNDTEVVPITINTNRDKGNYCIQIRKKIFLRIIFLKIGWTDQTKVTAGLTPSHQGTYYASTSKKFFPLVKKITSSDGTGGDGVKVLVE